MTEAPSSNVIQLEETRARHERSKITAAAQPGAAAEPLPALSVIDPTEWDGVPIPPREWIVPDWLPIGHTTLLYADGGVGKSLLTLQLMAASSLGAGWLLLPTLKCRSVGLFAEDEPDELQRRLSDIVAYHGSRFADLGNMRLLSGVGRSNLLAKIGRDGSISTTDRWDELRGVALEHGARLVGVDTAATSFAGNENDRSAVTQFVGGVLTGLAQEINGAVILNAHPSRGGMLAGGSMDSGSTGWRASARSMLSLEVPKNRDGQPIPSARLLTRRKANYASSGDALRLAWHGGVLAPEGSGDRVADAIAHATAELTAIYREGGHVSSTMNGGFSLGSVLARRGRLGGFAKDEINQAVLTCLGNGSFEQYQVGRAHDAGPKVRPAGISAASADGRLTH